MRRYDGQRLDDVDTAVTAIRCHLARGDLSDGLVFDAVRIRSLEIGEAVTAISPSLLATEPGIPWKNIAAMRDQLAHRYFDTEHGIVQGTVTKDLEPLLDAVHRLQAHVTDNMTGRLGGVQSDPAVRPTTRQDEFDGRSASSRAKPRPRTPPSSITRTAPVQPSGQLGADTRGRPWTPHLLQTRGRQGSHA